MPKKCGENTKATASKARKAAAREIEETQKKQKADEEYWRDDDKHVNKKQQRKAEQDKRKSEANERKATNRALYEEEMGSVKEPASKAPPTKVTRAQIQTIKETSEKKAAVKPPVKTHLDDELVENVNRLAVEGDEARSVTDAISILSTASGADSADRHPERRVKAAFLAFEERNLPILKNENPNMRLSQLKQQIRKEWLKSPENPMNQASMAYNEGK